MLSTAEDLQARGRLGTLSESERQIVALVVSGCGDDEIARRLFLSPKTVEWSLAKVYRKLGLRSRADLSELRRAGSQSNVESEYGGKSS